MKLVLILSSLIIGFNAFAEADLQNAFQQAIQHSEQDKNKSLTSINLDHETRLAAWRKHKKEVVKVPGTSAVDMPDSWAHSQVSRPTPQVDTDHYVTNELSDLK